MSKIAPFRSSPPLRFELTPEQVEQLEAAKPAGSAVMVFGYAQRHPWPDPDRFTLCAWFVPASDLEASLIASGVMSARKRQKTRRKPARRSRRNKPTNQPNPTK